MVDKPYPDRLNNADRPGCGNPVNPVSGPHGAPKWAKTGLPAKSVPNWNRIAPGGYAISIYR